MAHVTVPISKIQPNPWRDMETYPLLQNRIDALVKSFEATGYWGNILARERNGSYEIAYGHHRREALRRRYNHDQEVRIIVEHLDDEQMMKIMSRENLPDWAGRASATMETVRSLVQAYHADLIKIPPPESKTRKSWLRYAPSYLKGRADIGSPDKPYTSRQLGAVLGESYSDNDYGDEFRHIRNALNALECLELGLCDAEAFNEASNAQAELISLELLKQFEIATTGEDPVEEKEAKTSILELSKNIATTLKTRGGRVEIEELTPDDPDALGKAAGRVSFHCRKSLIDKRVVGDLKYLGDYRKKIPHGNLAHLHEALLELSSRALGALKALGGKQRTKKS